MSKAKRNRRIAAGDADPTMTSQSNATFAGAPQPLPYAPQGPGNMRGNDMNRDNMGGGMPQPGSLSGGPQSMYGDEVFGPDVFAKVGTPGFEVNITRDQRIVAGRGLNADYGAVQQPLRESQDMMLPMALAQEAAARAEKLYGPGAKASYTPGPLGMMGFDMDQAQAIGYVNPGAFPPTIAGQSPNGLSVQGVPDVQTAVQVSNGMAPDNGGMVPGSTKKTIRKK